MMEYTHIPPSSDAIADGMMHALVGFETPSPTSSPSSDATYPRTSTPPSEEEPDKPFVHIPDMFTSIMSAEARINPHYAELKKERDQWIADVMGQDPKWAVRNAKVDLAYLASAWAPDTDKESMRIMMDWNHWVFLFDDQFDEGHLMTDPLAAQEECDRNMAILEDGHPPIRVEDNPIQYAFQSIWERLRERSSPETQRHWKVTHRQYFDGLVQQTRLTRDGGAAEMTVKEYMDLRVLTIGAYPAIGLTEFAFGIRVPDHVFNHPSIQKCMRISAELVVLVNDILSYKKDLSLGGDLNIFRCLLNTSGQGHDISTRQQVMEAVAEMTRECYRSWYLALADLPSWDEETDRIALQLVEICRNVALGNLYWSFRTGRYLGPAQGQQVRDTRILELTLSDNLAMETLYACENAPRK